MAQQSPIGNPFMLMLNPEIVLAAIENSERLAQLNRHLCRPLDRHSGSPENQRENSASDDLHDVVDD